MIFACIKVISVLKLSHANTLHCTNCTVKSLNLDFTLSDLKLSLTSSRMNTRVHNFLFNGESDGLTEARHSLNQALTEQKKRGENKFV